MFYRPRRRPSTMRAAIRVGGRDRTVGIVDVSETGIRLAVSDAFAEGQAVTVVTPRMELPGTVRWVRRGEIGIVLERRLSSSEQGELSGISRGL